MGVIMGITDPTIRTIPAVITTIGDIRHTLGITTEGTITVTGDTIAITEEVDIRIREDTSVPTQGDTSITRTYIQEGNSLKPHAQRGVFAKADLPETPILC